MMMRAMRAVFRNYANADERLDTPTPDVFGAAGATWYRVSVPFDASDIDAEDLIDAATEAQWQMDATEAAAIRREARRYHYQAMDERGE
jgi:hypothetical protein